MTKDQNMLTFTRTVKIPAAHLYYAFTKRSGWNDWFSEGADGDVHKFKQLVLVWKKGQSVILRFTTLKENQQLAFTWYGAEGLPPSEVNVELHEQGDGTEVIVEHRGVSADEVERITKLWENGLNNLKSVFEDGVDLRISARPMFGVMIEDMITPDIAKKKKLPAEYGMLLSDTLKGMGAKTSGLTGGDLIVEISGVKIEDYNSVDQVLSPRNAGDMVEMHYFRGKDKHIAQVELTLRPMPEVPPTAQDFSEKVSEIYKSANAKLDEVIEGVTEEQVEYRQKPGEWNSKDIFAHMIATERDMYAWTATLVQGNETYGWTERLPARLKSIQAIYPQILDLRRGLESTQDEGVVLISELPGEFVSRKSSYVRLVNSFFMTTPYHYNDHIDQIQENLTAAQGVG